MTGAGEFTVKLNAGNDALARPLLTDMMIPLVVPTSVLEGIPLRRPVRVLNAAQFGQLVILNVRVLPLISLADGVKVNADPA